MNLITQSFVFGLTTKFRILENKMPNGSAVNQHKPVHCNQ